MKFYAHESCGKCVPCREGGTWLIRILERVVTGHGTDADLVHVLEVGQTICPGDMPHASSERLGLAPRPFPYKMTTICFRGPVGVRAGPFRNDPVPRGVRGESDETDAAHDDSGHGLSRGRRRWR